MSDDDMSDDLPDDIVDDVTEETGDEEPVPHLPPGPAPEVVDWVDKLTAHLESPDRGESLWCPQWQDHPEAVWRFTALYEEFRVAFLEGTVSGWWVNHFDRHMPFLFGPTGIFQACENEHDPDRVFRFARRA